MKYRTYSSFNLSSISKYSWNSEHTLIILQYQYILFIFVFLSNKWLPIVIKTFFSHFSLGTFQTQPVMNHSRSCSCSMFCSLEVCAFCQLISAASIRLLLAIFRDWDLFFLIISSVSFFFFFFSFIQWCFFCLR